MNIGVEKINMHEGVIIKVLLDSGAIGMFMDRQMAAKHGFKLQKLERLIAVRNCKEAKLQARIKLTTLCSAIDKKNSIESLLDFAILYIQLLLWLCTLSPTVLMPIS